MKKFKLSMVITIVSLLITSCGSDSGGGISTGFNPNGGWGVGSGDISSGATGMNDSGQNLYNNLVRSISCRAYYGDGGRRGVINGSISTSTGGTTIGGTLNQQLISGESNTHYVGVTSEGDIMIVTEANDGSRVTGYNVRLSLCNRYLEPESYGKSFPLIGADRGVGSIGTTAIALMKNTTCAAGLLTHNNSSSDNGLFIEMAPYNYNNSYGSGTLQSWQYRLFFYPPAC